MTTHEPLRSIIKNISGFPAIIISLCLLSACGGGGGPPPPENNTPATNIDVTGVWAGTWSGTNPNTGEVNGTWEGDVIQTGNNVDGKVVLSGDIDCAEGILSGFAGDTDLTGSLQRSFLGTPCPRNLWEATSINTLAMDMSGTWTQPSESASGTFTGRLISKPGGPRMTYFHPPGGLPGTIITILGEGFSLTPTDNVIEFKNAASTEFLSVSPTKLTMRVPAGASTGSIFLFKDSFTAISPLPFKTNVSFPSSNVSRTITVDRLPEKLVIRPDGRRVFVSNTFNSTISMFDTATGVVMGTTSLGINALRGMTASPDGRRIYVSVGSEIKVLDGNKNAVLDNIPLNVSGIVVAIPQALTISLEGRELYIIDTRGEGSVLIVDIETKAILSEVPLGMNAAPFGIALSPDGKSLFVSDEINNTVQVISTVTRKLLAPQNGITVGTKPGGIVFSPDGKQAYVVNRGSNNVSVITTATHTVETNIIPVATGTGSPGISISPDGKRVYVANKTSGGLKGTLAVIDTASRSVVDTIVVGIGGGGIAISPDGKRGFIINSEDDTVTEIGGSQTLSVLKAGTGIGTVHSSIPGISCGTNCQADFNAGTIVTLTARPDSTSTFTGWSGDCPSNGIVTLNARKICTATFTVKPATGGGTGRTSRHRHCFIATAAYGSYMEPHVQVLRDFRDKYLITNPFGESLVLLYYRYSPPLADIIASHGSLRFTTRMVLTPLIFTIKYPLVSIALILILFAALIQRRHWLRARA